MTKLFLAEANVITVDRPVPTSITFAVRADTVHDVRDRVDAYLDDHCPDVYTTPFVVRALDQTDASPFDFDVDSRHPDVDRLGR